MNIYVQQTIERNGTDDESVGLSGPKDHTTTTQGTEGDGSCMRVVDLMTEVERRMESVLREKS